MRANSFITPLHLRYHQDGSTDETVTRRGIPILEDLPPWFSGLRYLFGMDLRASPQRELLIALQVHALDPLPIRVARGQQVIFETGPSSVCKAWWNDSGTK